MTQRTYSLVTSVLFFSDSSPSRPSPAPWMAGNYRRCSRAPLGKLDRARHSGVLGQSRFPVGEDRVLMRVPNTRTSTSQRILADVKLAQASGFFYCS
jgi:hypothetical protein